ncbi:unnamed protein product [Acanthoscelides obtectus]|uniref:Uncharacterized protein n=1 Tax=Acanthoscelides obtectus TaxID=200917 RepID=A0A9P0L4N6_ACAOB|nr:unnamed protein product [Acanthoscelides obtectus]CAK1639385.1 hypothetical protein AOBTE_LOCUS11156 [Acanthoscelides obtectus]
MHVIHVNPNDNHSPRDVMRAGGRKSNNGAYATGLGSRIRMFLVLLFCSFVLQIKKSCQ